MKNYRACQELGHQDQQASHLCSFRGCDQNIFLCATCLKDDKHIHGQQNLKHIINFPQFKKLIQEKLACIIDYNQQREEMVKLCKTIAEEIEQNLIKKIKGLRDFQEISQLINRIKSSSFLDIEREQVKQILFIEDEINLQRSVLTQVSDKISQILQNDIDDKNSSNNGIEQFIKIEQNNSDDKIDKFQKDQIQQIQNQKIQQDDEQKQLNYNIVYEHESDQEINAVAVSPNENFLVYGGKNNTLTIIDLSIGQVVKQIQLETAITVCAFTKKSNKLFVGDQQGILYSFDDQFDMIYDRQIYLGQIKGIAFINDKNILSFSSTNQIKLSDLQANLKHTIQKSKFELSCVEYQRMKQHSVIISCTQGNDINFHSVDTGKLLSHFNKIHDKFFAQQLLPIKGLSFLTANTNQIIIWLVNKDISKMHIEFQIQLNLIQNISLVKHQNEIMVITQNCIQLFDRLLKKQVDLYQINYQNQTNVKSLKQIQQADSMKYIISLSESNFY